MVANGGALKNVARSHGLGLAEAVALEPGDGLTVVATTFGTRVRCAVAAERG